MELTGDWRRVLREEADSYARLALANIRREFPASMHHMMKGPGDFPYRPRARTPVFYGSFDWHSCVQMHWLLIRLLRTANDCVPAREIRSVLGSHFEPVALAAEEDFIAGPDSLADFSDVIYTYLAGAAAQGEAASRLLQLGRGQRHGGGFRQRRRARSAPAK